MLLQGFTGTFLYRFQKEQDMTDKQIHETAIRLLEGGREFYDGHWFRAIKVAGNILPCDQCEMDSLCTREVISLCAELDSIASSRCMLILADGKGWKIK